jgi:hypothetical protein
MATVYRPKMRRTVVVLAEDHHWRDSGKVIVSKANKVGTNVKLSVGLLEQ